MNYDLIKSLRAEFPALAQTIHHGKPLIYLDSAASAQKPKIVIDVMNEFYSQSYANVHRGVHYFSVKATEAFEAVREKVQAFIRAPSSDEVIFTSGTTAGINLIADCYGRHFIKSGDEIIISLMEHHANIVPWQLLATTTGAKLKIIPLLDNGELDLNAYEQLLNTRTKLVAITHASNTLGTINPIQFMTAKAHTVGAIVVVDGAQAVPHFPVNVTQLDCDFYVFSAHKLFGPTGTGVLYGKKSLLQKMPPYQSGGAMILEVKLSGSTFKEPPHKFEAGTPNIAGVLGLGAAIDFTQQLPWSEIMAYEDKLLQLTQDALLKMDDIQVFGTAKNKVPLLSFINKNIHAHDIGTILDTHGIAVRSGHHCAMPLWEHLKVSATTRLSFSFYNTIEEVEKTIKALLTIREIFSS